MGEESTHPPQSTMKLLKSCILLACVVLVKSCEFIQHSKKIETETSTFFEILPMADEY